MDNMIEELKTHGYHVFISNDGTFYWSTFSEMNTGFETEEDAWKDAWNDAFKDYNENV